MKRTIISTVAVTALIGFGIGTTALADGHKGHKGMKGKHAEKHAEMLEKYDANDDGKLDETEREAARLAKFADIDTDGSGTLTPEEMTAYHAAKAQERMAQHFAKEDVNGDGVISADEFGSQRKARQEKRKAHRAEILEKFDADGDGKLSADERKAAHEAGYGRHKRPDGPPPPPPGDTPEE